jgi:hypothetical protein
VIGFYSWGLRGRKTGAEQVGLLGMGRHVLEILRPQCIFWTGANANARSSVGFRYILRSRQSQNRRWPRASALNMPHLPRQKIGQGPIVQQNLVRDKLKSTRWLDKDEAPVAFGGSPCSKLRKGQSLSLIL